MKYSGSLAARTRFLSLAVLLFTFPGKHSHVIIVPGLVTVFGVPFGVAYMVAQLTLLAMMKSHKGIALAIFFMVLAVVCAFGRKALMPWPVRLDPSVGHTFVRYVVVAASCVGGGAVGIGFTSGWLSRRE